MSPGLRILQPGTNEGVSFLGTLDFHEHEALGARPGLSGRPFVEAGVLSYWNVKISSSKVSSFTGLASWLLTFPGPLSARAVQSAFRALGGVAVRGPFLPPFILGFRLWAECPPQAAVKSGFWTGFPRPEKAYATPHRNNGLGL